MCVRACVGLEVACRQHSSALTRDVCTYSPVYMYVYVQERVRACMNESLSQHNPAIFILQ